MGERLCKTFLGQVRHAAFAAVAVLLVLLGVASTADAKGRTTLVGGYVSAGSPVKGASLSIYGPSGSRLTLRNKRGALKSDAQGFFVLVLPGQPRSVRVVATGGTVKGRKLHGSLQAIVQNPRLAQSAFINPVTTVVAAYAARRPRAPLTVATRQTRRLFRLNPNDATGRELLGPTPYFDGLKFLNAARTRGGVQRYVAFLIARGRPVAFRGPRRQLKGVEDYVKLITTAKNALSGIYSVGKFAYDIFKWTQGPEEDKTGKILEAVQQMQKQLEAIQASLNNIQGAIDKGFQRIHDAIDVAVYNQMVAPLKRLGGIVRSAHGAFQDLISNASSPDFDAVYADRKLKELTKYMAEIIPQFKAEDDVFRDSILRGTLFTTPTYAFAAKALLAGSAHFMTPADSAQLQNFATYMLQFQALAFNLIIRWETKPGSMSSTLKDAMKLYLGFDSIKQAQDFVNATSPTLPDAGDLRDEADYLATIKPVPPHTIVDSNAVGEFGKGTGMMWESIQARTSIFDFANLVHLPGGLWCANTDPYHLQEPYNLEGKLWCPYMWNSWYTANTTQMTAAEKIVAGFTGLGGWQPADLKQAEVVLGRTADVPDVRFKFRYWTPDSPGFMSSGYQASDYEQICPPNDHCGSRYFPDKPGLVDAMTVKTIDGPTATVGSCTFGVGKRKGTDCPALLYALLGRMPDKATEHYWPALPP